jgi:hypothetical protein
MTSERKKEIEQAIIRAMSRFGTDASKSHQSMGLIGLSQMRRDIPRNEFLNVLQSMEGVILDFEASPAQVLIPTSYFTHL